MDKQAKIYVAGHRGLVGSAIVRTLQTQGYENFLFRTSTELDLRDQAAVESFFAEQKPEYVFLAAAKVGGIHANNSYPADFIRDNLQVQTNVIDSAYRHGVTKLLFLGSSCIYPKLAPQPLKEEYLLTGPLESSNEWYAIAKIAGIKMCQAYRRQYGFNAISAMPTNLYGPNDNFDLNNSHVLPALIRKFHLAKMVQVGDLQGVTNDEKCRGRIPDDILNGLQITRTSEGKFISTGKEPEIILWGSGTPRREFLHVDDMAAASVYLMQQYDDEEIVNVGAGVDLQIKELAAMVQKTVGFTGKVIWDSGKPDGTPQKLMDTAKLNQHGWHPTIALAAGIAAVYQHYLME
jgi:GDP-L-fucose synthase